MKKTHFISGLPRSGSTLLAGILKQNPRFHAAMTSPISPLLGSALEQMGVNSEYHSFFCNGKRKAICQSLFDAYYHDKADKDVIFDTNRYWTARLHQLAEIFGDIKMICCVRNPAWVMDSLERIYRKNPLEHSRIYSANSRLTVYTRCESLLSASGLVGSAWSALKEAYYGELSNRLLLVDYELLCKKPRRTIELIYQFLDEPVFAHNFTNVEYEESEFDKRLGAQGLHTVKREVEFTPRRTILPPDLFAKYDNMDFWQDTQGTAANIIAPKKAIQTTLTRELPYEKNVIR